MLMLRRLYPHRHMSVLWLAAALLVLAAGCGPEPGTTPTATPITGGSPTGASATSTSAATEQPTSTQLPTQVEPTDTVEVVPSPTVVSGTPTPTTGVGNYSWTQVGLAGVNLRDMELLPQGENLVLVGAANGAWRSEYDYTNWEKLDIAPGSGSPPAASVSLAIGSADVMYATGHTGCASGLPITSYHTTDGGKTWEKMGVEVVSVAAANASIAYATTCIGVLKSTDSGATWSAELPGSRAENRDPYAVVTSPDGETVFVAYASEGGTGQINRSTDGGNSWTDVTPKNAPAGDFRAPAVLVYLPGSVGRPDDGGLYMVNDHGLWHLPTESPDWTLTERAEKSDVPTYYVTALYVDTAYSEAYNKPGPVIYEARERAGVQSPEGLGVFRSTDLGKTWEQVGDNLGGRTIMGLTLAPHDPSVDPKMVETLLAATSDGVWAVPMPPPFR